MRPEDRPATYKDKGREGLTAFEKAAAEQSTSNILAEFWTLLRYNKKWWLLPVLVAMLLLGMLVFWIMLRRYSARHGPLFRVEFAGAPLPAAPVSPPSPAVPEPASASATAPVQSARYPTPVWSGSRRRRLPGP